MKTRFSSETLAVIIPMILLVIIGIIALWYVSPKPSSQYENVPVLSMRYFSTQILAYRPFKQALFALIGLLMFKKIRVYILFYFDTFAYRFGIHRKNIAWFKALDSSGSFCFTAVRVYEDYYRNGIGALFNA